MMNIVKQPHLSLLLENLIVINCNSRNSTLPVQKNNGLINVFILCTSAPLR